MSFPSDSTASPPSKRMIRVSNLVRSYQTAAKQVQAVRSVSLDVFRGEQVAILGKSGSGKSTLLHLLGGLDQPTSGTIQVNDLDLERLSSRELAQYRLSTVGIIFQTFHLIPSRTAVQNVELPMIFAGRPPGERREAARLALEAVGLGPRLHHRPTELSGGEQQRVAIARAIVNQPQLLLADEPTGNLDSENAEIIIAILTRYAQENQTTLVLVTHDEEMAQRCATRILRMRDGQLVSIPGSS